MKILLEAPILTQSGYGEHARLVFKSLMLQKGIEVYTNPLNWGATSWASSLSEDLKAEIDLSINRLGQYVQISQMQKQQLSFDVQIHVGIPSEFEKRAPYSICVTAGIETDRVSPEWILRSHKGLDKLIVPSQHAKSGFDNTKYEVTDNQNKTMMLENISPIEVVPYPVKEIEPTHLDFKTETGFNFLSVALMGPRKNLENMIKWFIEEFKGDNVGLILKTGHRAGGAIDFEATVNVLEKLVGDQSERKCKVYLLHGDLEESEIHSLYLRDDVHAYVSATHGEGYGLPIFEAAYSGLPVVATDWSAHTEFLTAPYKEGGKTKDKKLFAKVDYSVSEIPKEAVWKDILHEGSQWAYPKESSFKRQIRSVYKNHGMYKKWARSLQKHIVENYKFDSVVEKMKNCIFDGLGLQDSEVELDIDKLKEQALSIQNVKDRATFAKEVLQNDLSQIEKLQFLKDLFKGDKAVLLSCGPTLTDHDPQKVKDLLKDNLGVSIKQSFQMFEDFIDLHLYNCGNFKNYDYSNNRPIVMEASTSPLKLGECDIKFFIRERDFNKSVAATKDFDSWTFEKQPLLRPYGPGIMYEVVFYALQHLGVSDIITIGWDNKHIEGTAAQQHFYDKIESDLDKKDFIDSNEVAQNATAVATFSEEDRVSTEAISNWAEWLSTKGTKITIVSSINPAPDSIDRMKL